MWKAGLIGALASASLIALTLSAACVSLLAPGVCRASGTIVAQTIKKPERHSTYTDSGAPQPYREQTNPLRRNIGNLIEGSRLYDAHCAACHGTLGFGDGESGEELSTQPADLSAALADKRNHDDYFFWTISEGGSPFKTDMPSFKSTLAKHDIWKVIIFLRAVLDESNQDPTGGDNRVQP